MMRKAATVTSIGLLAALGGFRAALAAGLPAAEFADAAGFAIVASSARPAKSP